MHALPSVLDASSKHSPCVKHTYRMQAFQLNGRYWAYVAISYQRIATLGTLVSSRQAKTHVHLCIPCRIIRQVLMTHRTTAAVPNLPFCLNLAGTPQGLLACYAIGLERLIYTH